MIIIAKSDIFAVLSDIYFADKDPDSLTRDILKKYKDSSGRELARADPVRLFADAIILALLQQRHIIDHAAKMNLLAYSSGYYLDHLGALLGVYRLSASSAVCEMQATLSAPLSYDAVIPEGTRFQAAELYFSAAQTITIPAGQESIIFTAKCDTPGAAGNGFTPGQITRLADPLPVSFTFENITESSGGTDEESDEAFRERIQIAPESFSVAGPVRAYEYFARSAHADIIDVAVVGPPTTQPGHVNIYPLLTGGTLPDAETLDAVLKICSADDVRPDTDYVHVLSPEAVNYDLDLRYWVDEKDSAGLSYIRAQVEAAVDEWAAWQKSSLGRDINPSELVHRVVAAGAKRCEVVSPAFEVLADWQVAECVNRTVIYEGLEKG